MSEPRPRWLVVQVAALGWNLLESRGGEWAGLRFAPLNPPEPGLTCPAQAEFRTAAPVRVHGMVANGLYHRALRRPMFWEQAGAQVSGPRIWEDFRAGGGRVGLMFWQQSLGEAADLLLSPRPIHKHGGGMIQDCHSRPDDLYDRLCRRIGRKFNLMHYWGPLASHASSAWIVDAVRAVLEMEDLCPELLLTYLPHLDYDTQRHGPESPAAARALVRAEADVRALAEAAQARGFRLLVWGDYAMQNVSGPAIFPNRLLREAGWLPVRRVKGMAYPDLWSARAFAVADHQTAQIHIPDPADVEAVREGLTALDGVASVFRPSENPEWDHPNAGELIALAQPGRWFAYPWWTAAAEAPDFASHVDIHNKPGFDPCELFFGRFPWQVCQDTSRVGGTHGAGGRAAWACDDPGFRPAGDPTRLRDLALALRDRLGGGAV